jgi:hypothetical protein
LRRTGNLDRLAKLAGVRAFTGMVPKVDQSGTADQHRGPTKAGDPGLREALFLPPISPAGSTRLWRRAITVSSSTKANITTRRCGTSRRYSSVASPPAGATNSYTSCATLWYYSRHGPSHP